VCLQRRRSSPSDMGTTEGKAFLVSDSVSGREWQMSTKKRQIAFGRVAVKSKTALAVSVRIRKDIFNGGEIELNREVASARLPFISRIT
jgi:hypothetical protein